MGFEYWADPANPLDGFITWQSAGKPTARMGASAVGPNNQNPETDAMVGQRLIPEEPMSIILNLGISSMLSPSYHLLSFTNAIFPANWQTITPSTLEFPAEMLIDYVRVYQRKGQTNIGCDPVDYPTAEYIANHLDTYSSMS